MGRLDRRQGYTVLNLDDVFESSTVEREYKRTIAHLELVRVYWDEISAIKELIANGQDEEARMLWNDRRTFTESVKIGLWRAPTKGGCWTIMERNVLKPNESTHER